MKPIATLIAIGLATSLTVASRAATDSAMPIAASDAGAGNDRLAATLRGVVTAVDERNDSITLRLPSEVITKLRVRDGLLFNAVRYGDQVEVTVENIDGAETIVGLR